MVSPPRIVTSLPSLNENDIKKHPLSVPSGEWSIFGFCGEWTALWHKFVRHGGGVAFTDRCASLQMGIAVIGSLWNSGV